jgi:predicted HicB family RNase H-like nuclease
MALKAGKPTTAKSQKDLAMEAVKNTDDEQEISKAKTQRFNVDIPETLHRAIKMQAAKEGIKLNVLTAKLFEEYLSKVSKE